MDVDPTIHDRRYLGAWIESAATGEEPRVMSIADLRRDYRARALSEPT